MDATELRIARVRHIDMHEAPDPGLLDAALALADEVERLRALHTPRDTRKGEWPEEGQDIQRWFGNDYGWRSYRGGDNMHVYLWLPAPPAPSPPTETEGN
jgi:hypothetical protein